MYRIRFHGRGGQGMKTASQILGTALFLEGFEVQDAPRYGAERRGAPITCYVRAARAPIHERGVITRPDLVVVADETLIAAPVAGVLQGVGARTTMLINSAEPTATWAQRLKFDGLLVTIPTQLDKAGPDRLGATCAGAAARVLGTISESSLTQALRHELGSFSDTVLQNNIDSALAAFEALQTHAGCVSEGETLSARDYEPPAWIDLALESASASAPAIHAAATSELANTGVWRTLRPVIDYEHCNRCSWVCSTLCPDSAIKVEADHTPRIDYDHCKGCMVCVAVCPPHAIRAVPEVRRVEVAP
jgi:pyruvate ferredoxin oxidoreductase gamma subunit